MLTRGRKSIRRSLRGVDRHEAERASAPKIDAALQARIMALYMHVDRVTVESLPSFVAKLQLSLPPNLDLRHYVGEALADNPYAIVQPEAMFRIVADVRTGAIRSGRADDVPPERVGEDGEGSLSKSLLLERMECVFPTRDAARVAADALLPSDGPLPDTHWRALVGEDVTRRRLRMALRARGAPVDEWGVVQVPTALLCGACRELRMTRVDTQRLIDDLDPYGTARVPLEVLERLLRAEFATREAHQPAPVSHFLARTCAAYVAVVCSQDYVDSLVPPPPDDLSASLHNAATAPPTLDMLGARLQVLSAAADLKIKKRYTPRLPLSPRSSRRGNSARPRTSNTLPSVQAPTKSSGGATARGPFQRERYRSFLMDSGVLRGVTPSL